MNRIAEMAEQAIAFVRRNGLKVLECRPGVAACRMPLAGNENHLGHLYAGAQFTLADITGGVLLLASFDPEKFYPTLKDLRMEFLKPALSDLSLRYEISEAELEALRQSAAQTGKAKILLQGELLDHQGVVVAKVGGEFQIRARDPSPFKGDKSAG